MGTFDLGSASLGTEIDLSGLHDGINKARSDAESGFGDIGASIGKSLTTGIVAAGAIITTALGGVMAGGITSFMGFERQMNEVFTLLPGVTQQAMGQMSNDVQAFAIEFGALPQDVVPALYESLSSGVPPGNVFDFLAVAQKAAVGGVTDTKTTVDGLTSVVNAYGSDVLSVQQASDQMFTAVAYGKTTFAELAGSLYNVIPNAQALGVKFSDVTAAIAAMTAQGVPTAQSTTQLRQLMIELSQAGGETSEMFTRIAGMGFKDFIASGRSLQDALILMEQAAQQSGVGVNDLFSSVEAGSAALTLTGRGTESFTAALDQMQGSAGATDAAYAQMDQGIGRSVDRMKASFAVLLADVGERLGPTFAVFADWINANMPMISDVVGQVFQAIGNAIAFVLPYFSAFVQGVQQAFGIFIELGSAAMQWGQNIAQQLANGILAGAGAVIDSLGYIGDLITYWLEPHSPPKLLPDIDQWGTDTAQVYLDGWGQADFGVFNQMGSTIESLLKGMVSSGILPEEGMIPMLLGSREAVAAAINELRTTGSVSEAAFQAVRDSAGAAGNEVDQMFRSMVALEQANRAAADAQAELNAITDRYSAILDPMEAELQAIRDQQQDLRDTQREAELQKIINSVGGDDSIREAARLELEALLLEKKIRETRAAQNAEEESAEAKLDAAAQAKAALEAEIALQREEIAARQRHNDLIQQQIALLTRLTETSAGGGGGGGGGGMDDAARKAEQAAKAQRDYNYAIADTETKLGMLKEEQAKYTEADAEYWRLQGQITGMEKQKQTELEVSAKAQRDYELSLMSTEDQLRSLKEEQGRYAVGSEDYNRIQKDIDKVEKERTRQLEEVEKKNTEAAKAERDYQYAVADTGGKLDILRGELANTVEGSADYWRIKTQINSLEQTQQQELAATSKAMGGAGAAVSGLAGGVGNLSGMLPPLMGNMGAVQGATETAGAAASTTSEQYAAMKDKQLEAADAAGAAVSPLGLVERALASLAPYADALGGAMLGMGAVLLGPQVAGALGAIGSALAFIVSPLGLMLAGAALLGMAWTTNFAGIRDVTMKVIGAVMGVIGPAISLVVSWFEENGPDIVAFWTTTWNDIEGVVSTVLQAVGSVITTVFGAVQTFLSTHGDKIKGFFTKAWTAIKTIITGVMFVVKTWIVPVLTEIAAFISRNQDAIVGFITGAWDLISGIIGGALDVISGIVNVFMGLFTGDWDLMWNGVMQILQGIWDAIKGVVVGALEIIGSTIELAWSALGSAIYLAWNLILDIFGAVWNAILLVIGTALGVILTGITTAWDAVSAVFIAAWDTISTFFSGVWDFFSTRVSNGLDVVKGAIQTAWDTVSGIFSTVWNNISTFFSGLWDGLTARVSGGVDVVKTTVQTAWDTVSGICSTVWNAIKDTISGVWDGIKLVIDTVLGLISSAISGVWTTIKDVATTSWDGIKGAISGAWDAIKLAIDTVLTTIKDALTGAWDTIKTAASTAWGAIKDALIAPFQSAYDTISGMVQSFIDIGTDIIDGITGAIWGGGGKVAAALVGVVNNAKDEARAAAEIQSPSKLFARDVGAHLPGGVAMGAEEAMPSAMDSIRTTMDTLFAGSMPLALGGGLSLPGVNLRAMLPTSVPSLAQATGLTAERGMRGGAAGAGDTINQYFPPVTDTAQMRAIAKQAALDAMDRTGGSAVIRQQTRK